MLSLTFSLGYTYIKLDKPLYKPILPYVRGVFFSIEICETSTWPVSTEVLVGHGVELWCYHGLGGAQDDG